MPSLSYSQEEPPPVALRPFADKSIGGWLGRLASRYRVSLELFALRYGIDLPWDATNVGWMLMPPLPKPTLGQIARVVRMSVSDIEAIQTPASWAVNRWELPVCATCLFINRQDVTAPYWMRAWLGLDPPRCAIHTEDRLWIAARHLRQCRNFAGRPQARWPLRSLSARGEDEGATSTLASDSRRVPWDREQDGSEIYGHRMYR